MQFILGLIVGFALASYLWNTKFKVWVDKNIFKKQPKAEEYKTKDKVD